MKHRSIRYQEKSTPVALLFFGFCALLVGVGILVKVLLLFSAAKFDGSHEFIFQVVGPSQSEVVALSPDSQTASVVHLKGNISNIQKQLRIPIDARVLADTSLPLSSLGQYILFHQSSEDSINLIDRIRIFLFTNNVNATAITTKTFSYPLSLSDDASLAQLFTDHTLYSDGVTIGVVNGTGASGVANDAAKLITTIGGDVMSVSTGSDTKETTLVYSGKPSYTTKRLAALFHATLRPTNTAMLTDVVLTIGEDDLSMLH